MKKSLVALAVLGAFAGTASAQSSVTIYGLLNLAVVKSNGGTATTSQLISGPSGNIWQLQNFATSRLGFRGTEDLGGGLSAQFQIEHRFAPDTGAASNPNAFWQGRSFVQLTSAAVGSVYMGRDYTPIFWVQLKTDPFGNDGIAQSGTGATYANYLTPDPAGNGARASNSVGFKSASFSGLTVQGAVSLSEGTQLGRGMGFNAEYTAGPIYAGVGYETIKNGTFDGTGVINVGGSYDFGVVKVLGYFARSLTRTPPNRIPPGQSLLQEDKNYMWSASVTAPLGGGLAKAMYYRVDPRLANNTRQKLGLGYDYFLSKRTNVYAEAAFGKEDLKTNNRGFGVGIKHLF